MAIRAFDLNIEKVLENWEVEHALREIIANALDEQVISKTAEIEIKIGRVIGIFGISGAVSKSNTLL